MGYRLNQCLFHLPVRYLAFAATDNNASADIKLMNKFRRLIFAPDFANCSHSRNIHTST